MSPEQTAELDDQQQRSAALRRLLLPCDCERVRVTAGGSAGTSDGDARFAGIREYRGQLKAGPYAGPPRVPQIASTGFRRWHNVVASRGLAGLAPAVRAKQAPRCWRGVPRCDHSETAQVRGSVFAVCSEECADAGVGVAPELGGGCRLVLT